MLVDRFDEKLRALSLAGVFKKGGPRRPWVGPAPIGGGGPGSEKKGLAPLHTALMAVPVLY